nr:hypothetical protein [Candidatus Altiarchaeota archaeon]
MENTDITQRVVVFGIGGAGCKVINQLAKENQTNIALVAIDTDKNQISSVQGEVKSILIGEPLDADSEASAEPIKRQLDPINEVLSGASVVIVIAGLGRKTGTHVSGIIAEKVANLGILCLSIVILPSVAEGIGPESEGVIKSLREKTPVILVDNSMRGKDRKEPILDTYKIVNSYIAMFIRLISNSVMGIGSMNLTSEELRGFFQGGSSYIMTVGYGFELKDSTMKAFAKLLNYTDISSIQKILVGVLSMFEIGVNDMKRVGSQLQEKKALEELRWLACSDTEKKTRAILISGVSEIRLSKGTEALEEGAPNEEGKEGYDVIEAPLREVGMLQTTPPALVGVGQVSKRSGGAIIKKKEVEQPEAEEDVEGEEEEIAPMEKTRSEEYVEGIGEVEEPEGLDDVAEELTGFPSPMKEKKKKKTDEEKDEFGIGYV